MFVRTIYLWYLMPLFVTDNQNVPLKPTEGVDEHVFSSIEKQLKLNPHGFWAWMASSKSSDFVPRDRQKSYIFGAVYVAGAMTTAEYRAAHPELSETEQFQESSVCGYQLVIPMHKGARLELETPIPVHKQATGEQRVAGVWEPAEGASVYEALRGARFIE